MVFSLEGHQDFIYSCHILKHSPSLIATGAGNGWLLMHDVAQNGKCLFALGANQAAVRCIETTTQHLVAAGDDGKVLVYEF